MVRRRINTYTARIRADLRTAFSETHPPRELAGSFALGTFITMLPTFGLGLLVFVVLAAVFNWVSKLALLASVLVFNPVVKWGVYAASFALGVVLLGPIPNASMTTISLAAGPEIVIRLLVGNLILAVIASVLGYVLVLRVAVRYADATIAEKLGEVVSEVVDG